MRWRLLLPIGLGCLLMVLLAEGVALGLGDRVSGDRLLQRARGKALTLSHAASLIGHDEGIRELVAAVKGHDGLVSIIVVGDEPLRVIASTTDGWTGRAIEDIPDAAVRSDFGRALRGGSGGDVVLDRADVVGCIATRREGPVRAVLVEMDARGARQAVMSWALMAAGGLLLISIGVFAMMRALIERRLLRPVGLMVRAVRDDVPLDPSCVGRDELGLLARALQRSREEIARSGRELNRLAMVAERTSNAVVVTGPDRRIEWVNAGFTRITGYTLDEARGQSPGRLLQCAASDPAAIAAMREALDREQPCRVEIVNLSKDGREYVLDIEIQPIHRPDGTLDGFVAIESDITERKRQEAALARAKEDAEEASRAKSAFLANMSHEIRTPMTAILGYAELLEDLAGDPAGAARQREFIATIRRNGEHLLSIINDILDVSKIEAGRLAVEHARTDIARLLRDVESLLRVRADQRGLWLRTEWVTPPPEVIETDGVRLKQVLVNLVGNAIKFTERGGVTVRAAFEPDGRGRGRLRVEVEDTGIGMDEAALARLFRPFTQVDLNTARSAGGTGLGLSISLALARLLGGDLSVRSTRGVGSVFTVGIAVGVPSDCTLQSGTPVPQPRAAGAAPVGRRLAGLRVLLVDDGVDNRRLFERHLQSAGAHVEVCPHGGIALGRLLGACGRLAGPEPFDLIVTDMQMPEVDGYTLARTLRASGWQGPILALTAFAMEGDAERCLEAGCSAFLSKPVDRQRLLELCERLARRESGLRAA